MINKADYEVLSLLRRNARVKIVDLAEELSMPHSTAQLRIRRLQKTIIHKTCSVLNFSILEFPVRTLYLFSFPGKKRLSQELFTHCSVNNAYRTTTGFDYCLDCYFRNVGESNKFNEQLEKEGCKKISFFFVTEELKVEESIP